MTYFTEKNHNIWDRGEARGRLLLAKIVGRYIPSSINLYGCIGYIYCRIFFQLRLCLSGWQIKIFSFHEIQVPKWRWCQTRRHNFLNHWLTPCQPQLGMLPQDGSTRLHWLKWLIKLCIASVQLKVLKKYEGFSMVVHNLNSIPSPEYPHVRPVALIPQCTSLMPHNAPFCNKNVYTCANFCKKTVVGCLSDALWYLWDGFWKDVQPESKNEWISVSEWMRERQGRRESKRREAGQTDRQADRHMLIWSLS